MSNEDNAAANAVDDAEQQEDSDKVDRRKLKRGPKQRYWMCFAMRGQNPVFEEIAWPSETGKDVPNAAPEANNISEENVKRLFKEKHRLNPLVTAGPRYKVEDKAASAPRSAITVNARDMVRKTSKAYEGVFRGWKVLGNGLKAVKALDGSEFKDNELIVPFFEEPTSNDGDEKPTAKPRLKQNEVIRLADIENSQEI